MRHTLPLLLLLLAACPPKDTDTPTDTSQETETGQVEDTSTPNGPCGESGICPLTVSEAQVGCGDSPYDAETTLVATSGGPGALLVSLTGFQQGCCPQVDVTSEASQRTGQIVAWVNLYDDMCDCICNLDVSFRLDDIPAGGWTLMVESHSTQVTVD